MRFTNEHKNFRDGMKLIFDLFHYISKVNEKSYYTENAIHLIAKLCHKTIPNFSPCAYFTSSASFHYRCRYESLNLKKRESVLGIERSGLKDFVTIISALIEDQKCGIDDLLIINDIIHETHGYRYLKGSEYGDWIERINPDHNVPDLIIGSRSFSAKYKFPYINDDPVCEINDVKIGDGLQESWSQYALTTKDLNDPPFQYELFKVTYNPDSNFFKSLGKKSAYETISSPGHSDLSTYFPDFIIYVLVKYISLFGSLDRIKVCKNCGNLFFETKYGHGIFCNDICRVNYHVASEHGDIIRCRARQNRWLERKLNIPDTVKKEDCVNCTEWMSRVKSGLCLEVHNKNKTQLKKIKSR